MRLVLTEHMRYRIKDISHLLDIIDAINEKGLPGATILMSFDIVNLFPSINNDKGMEAVRLALNVLGSNKPSTECVLEGIQIYLCNYNSVFDKSHFLKTSGTETRALNSCSYFDIAISRLNQFVEQEQANNFKLYFFFGRYRDECFVL